MKTRLMHVRANVSNLAVSKKWYEEILEFRVSASWPPDKPDYIHFDSDKGAIFAIAEDDHFPSKGRFNFYIEDVDTLWNKLKDKVEILESLYDTAYGTRKFTILDPDGNELGFVKG
jgi:predicted enzyme related to lactoylglutathione lyase